MISRTYFIRASAACLALLIMGGVILGVWPTNQSRRIQLRNQMIIQMGPDVQVGELMAGSVKTSYLEGGVDQSDIPLVLIHGGGEGAVTWYPIFGQLAETRHVIAPDVVGYGESDKPHASYDADYFADWLNDFLDAKGLTTIDLVGSSQGGAIALHFAAKYPARVQRLVVADPSGFAPTPRGIFWHFLLLNSIPTNWLANQAFAYLVAQPSQVHPAWMAYGVEELRMPGGKNVFWNGRGTIVKTITDAKLAKIQAPTLVLWGAADTFYPVLYAEVAAKKIPNASLILLSNAGHLPFFDQPLAFSEAILNFTATR